MLLLFVEKTIERTERGHALLHGPAGPACRSAGVADTRNQGSLLRLPVCGPVGTNPHFLGARATGPEAGTYLLTGPTWRGQAGDEGTFDGVLPFDTDLVFVIGRTLLLGADDVPSLAEVMASYALQHLSAYRGQNAPPPAPVTWPVWSNEASRDERFIGFLNFLLAFCQPIHLSETERIV